MADRALHIGVDGRELLGQPTGVGRYLGHLLNHWASDSAWPHRLTVILPADPTPELSAWGTRITWLVERASHAGTWWEQTRLPRAAGSIQVDVFFAPAYTGPLRLRCPMVVTIHDLSYFAHPEWFSFREGLRRRWLTRASARRAAAILTVSESVAGEILARLPVPRERVHVVSHGAPAEAPGPTSLRQGDGGPPEPTDPGPMVLYVGSLFERRRIPDLLAAFARVVSRVPTARLVIVGEDRGRSPIDPLALADALRIRSQVDWRRYVSESELARLYAGARVFAFLSDYEGFGMTPLEAIAHGVPPVLLDTPVSREVYGTSARLVPPVREAIADALVALLTDDDRHAELVAAGRERLGAFSWSRTAATVQRVLEQAAARR